MEVGLAVPKARAIIEALNIEDPQQIDIEAIAMLRKLTCISGGLTGAEGRLVRGNGGGIIRVCEDIKSQKRKRFTIAHEIGHFELHKKRSQSTCTPEDFECWSAFGKEEEYQANVFAAELLMPERLFAVRCRGGRPGLERIDALSTLFQTSLTATAIRFVEFCREECAIVLSRDGKIRWGYAGPFFRFKHFQQNMPLDAFSNAYDYFHKGNGDRHQQSVDASAWFPKIRFRQDAMLKEQSWDLGDYGTVLTLLWIDQDI